MADKQVKISNTIKVTMKGRGPTGPTGPMGPMGPKGELAVLDNDTVSFLVTKAEAVALAVAL